MTEKQSPKTSDSAADPAAHQATPASIDSENQKPKNSDLPDFSQMLRDNAPGSIDRLNDVDLDVKIELGRTCLTVEQILKLGEGAVVELDKLAGDPVDVLVNEQLIARGEVLVVNDNFCVRINEILPGVSEAAKAL